MTLNNQTKPLLESSSIKGRQSMNIAKVDLSRQRRSKMDIIFDILETARDGASKTRIMYRANLSFAGLSTYLPFLLKMGLLTQESNGNSTVYKSTEKARFFLKMYVEVTQFINENKETRAN
jgi:predicted transcriptional regulator